MFHIEVITCLLVAVVAGGIIGLERTVHGRPAGFRTHVLICISSALLTIVGKLVLVDFGMEEIVRADPSRMAQAIMTGIGFLGAGSILKEKLTVRGLTTAASIWMTAAVGIVIGLEFYLEAVFATVLTIIVLVMFRWAESIAPTVYYRRLHITFEAGKRASSEQLIRLLKSFDIKSKAISFSVNDLHQVHYDMTIYTNKIENFELVSQLLAGKVTVVEHSISFTD